MKDEKEKAVALVIVLIVLAVLEVVIASLSFSSAVYLRRAQNESEVIQSRLLALGAGEMVQQLLSKPDLKWEERNEIFETGLKDVAMAGYALDVLVSDEQGKFNVNSLAEKDQKKRETCVNQWKALCRNLKKEDALMNAVLENAGKESGVAEGGAFMTVQHLLATGEVKWDDLYKRDEEKETYPLADCVTVWSDGKINVNTAGAEVIRALSPAIDAKKSDAVVEYRKTRPFRSANQFANVAGLAPEQMNSIKDIVTFDGEFYKLSISIKPDTTDDEEKEVLHSFTLIMRRNRERGRARAASGDFEMVLFRMER